MKSKKVTVRFPARLKTEMQTAVIKAGHGFHGKSRWLAEAIHLFLQQPNYIELVEHGIDINQAEFTSVEAFYVDEKTSRLIKKALLDVRLNDPLLEGVQSAFVRAAVVFSLLFYPKFPQGEK